MDEFGDEESVLTSSNRKYNGRNSNFQFYNKPKSFTKPKKFNTYREYYVRIPGVTTPTGVVLHQEF